MSYFFIVCLSFLRAIVSCLTNDHKFVVLIFFLKVFDLTVVISLSNRICLFPSLSRSCIPLPICFYSSSFLQCSKSFKLKTNSLQISGTWFINFKKKNPDTLNHLMMQSQMLCRLVLLGCKWTDVGGFMSWVEMPPLADVIDFVHCKLSTPWIFSKIRKRDLSVARGNFR